MKSARARKEEIKKADVRREVKKIRGRVEELEKWLSKDCMTSQ